MRNQVTSHGSNQGISILIFCDVDMKLPEWIGLEWCVGFGILGLKVFPAEAAGIEGNISNQMEIIKAWFQGEGDTFRDDRGFGSSERLGGEVKD